MAVFDSSMVHMDIKEENYTNNGYVINYSNGYRVEIMYDEWAESPREWENLGKMYYWHRRYDLGDKQIDMNYYNNFDELVDEIKEDYGEIIWLPLYLMDHSGISMSTSSRLFEMWDSAGWDWGVCGIIFASHDDIKKCYMVDEITDDVIDRATQCLIGEVEAFDQFIRGDVYTVAVVDENDICVDSCGGFFGFDDAKSEGQSMAEWFWNNFLSKTPVQGVLDFEE